MTRGSKGIVVGATLIALSSAGCYGQWALTRTLHGWNGRVTDNKFLNSLLTWVLIPVYGLAATGDFVIFNTIEFWSGRNPVALEEQPDGSVKLVYEGHEYRYRAVGPDEIEVSRDGVPTLRYHRDGQTRVVVTTVEGRPIADVEDGVAYARSPTVVRVY